MNKYFKSLCPRFSKCRGFLIMIKRYISSKSAIEKVFLYNLCHTSNVKTKCTPGYYHSGSISAFTFRYTYVVTHGGSNGQRML